MIDFGFELDVMGGIVKVFEEVGIVVCCVNKVFEGCFYIFDRIKNGEYSYIVNIIEGC